MSASLQIHDSGSTSISSSWRTAAAVKAQREAIVDLMRSVMKEGIDYGKIPGTPKPTLYKPGSEKLLSMFRLAAKPEAEDLSTPDTIRYRVRVVITEVATGVFVGEGLGEASSAETKYQWRKALCNEEWEDTPEDRRRRKWSKGENRAYVVNQVRAEMEDVANTVLKMAKKRAQIDGTLTVTAASDVFSQDAEEMKAAGIELGAEEQAPIPAEDLTRKQSVAMAAPTQAAAATQQPTQNHQAAQSRGPVISEAQARRFYAKWRASGRTSDEVNQYLSATFGITTDREMPQSGYDMACDWADRK